MKLKKNVSYFTSKTLFTLEKNEVLDIQISWCHQMSKCKTINTFYWKFGELTQSVNEIRQVHVLQKKNFYQKILQKLQPGH